MVRQCALASVNRAGVYARSKTLEVDDVELMLCRLMDEEYTRRPFYGSRRMVVYLNTGKGTRSIASGCNA